MSEEKRFVHLKVEGFRRLTDFAAELRPLCVMIGANGAGKTSILDVLHLLAASAQGHLQSSISDLQGLSSVLPPGASELRLALEMEAPSEKPLRYQLALRPQGTGYTVFQEVLSHSPANGGQGLRHIDSSASGPRYFDSAQGRLVAPSWDYQGAETSLSQVPRTFREPDEFRQKLASSTLYHWLNVDPRSPVRLPQPMRPAKLPGRQGEDLFSCLFDLRESDRDRFDALEETLRAAFRGFERLEFPPVAAGTLALGWRDKGLNRSLNSHQLSEGTLRFLWLTALLMSPGLPAVTLLDEPEVSLHPELLSLLADLLRQASETSQVIVATHSDRLVRFLDPAEVMVLDSDEQGHTTGRWADSMDIERWLDEYTLDEVWQQGRLGGRA